MNNARETQVLFFPLVLLDVMAENLNNVISQHREYDMFIEKIGVLRTYIEMTINDDEIDTLTPGRIFVVISESSIESLFTLEAHIMEGLDDNNSEVSMIRLYNLSDLPTQLFESDFTNNNYIFIKKVKTRSLSSEYIAELDINLLGVRQDMGHDGITSSLHIVPLYETDDGYKVTILPSNNEEGYPDNVMPPLCIYKEGYLLSINISARKWKNSCMGCYILENMDDWRSLIEGINSTVKDTLIKYGYKQENKKKDS